MLPGLAAIASLPALDVSVATDAEAGAWDSFVRTQPQHGYHLWTWRRVFMRVFNHDCIYLMARRGNAVEAVLPMVAIESRVFGRTLTSLPFLNYGGVLAANADAGQALVDRAGELARQRRCGHVELRHRERRFPDLPAKQHKVTMLLPIATGMWERLDRKVRNQIRKAEKSALTVGRGGAELLDDFYSVFSRNMRDLGTPVYPRRLFAEVLDAFSSYARLHVVRLDGRPVAAALTYRSDDTTEVPWASSIRDFNALCPNHLLYWHVIETAIADGCEVLDFGRSTPHEGTYKFKEQWGAVPRTLSWEYSYLANGAILDQSPKNPKFQVAVAVWKRSPLWLANALGPHIVRSIP